MQTAKLLRRLNWLRPSMGLRLMVSRLLIKMNTSNKVISNLNLMVCLLYVAVFFSFFLIKNGDETAIKTVRRRLVSSFFFNLPLQLLSGLILQKDIRFLWFLDNELSV